MPSNKEVALTALIQLQKYGAPWVYATNTHLPTDPFTLMALAIFLATYLFFLHTRSIIMCVTDFLLV